MLAVVRHLAAVVSVGCLVPAGTEPDPAAKPEAWVFVATEKGRWVIRVNGGPPKQVTWDMPKPKWYRDWVSVPGPRGPVRGPAVENGKRVVYHEDDPDAKVNKSGDRPHRLMIVDRDGKNPARLLTGLQWNRPFQLAPDGKSVFCGAEADDQWHLFRVPLDGSPPVKVSHVAGQSGPKFHVLPDGRVLYMAVTGRYEEPLPFGKALTDTGPAILTDGKTERVLAKEVMHDLPQITDDAARLAATRLNAAGEWVVEVTDLQTGHAEQFPVRAFHKDWAGRFRDLRLSPDGRALAVRFLPEPVMLRQNGPIAGDEALQHFGVIWFDGRKDRTALFQIDQQRMEHGYYPGIVILEWSAGPEVKP